MTEEAASPASTLTTLLLLVQSAKDRTYHLLGVFLHNPKQTTLTPSHPNFQCSLLGLPAPIQVSLQYVLWTETIYTPGKPRCQTLCLKSLPIWSHVLKGCSQFQSILLGCFSSFLTLAFPPASHQCVNVLGICCHTLPIFLSIASYTHTHTLPPTIGLCVVTCSVSQFKHHCLIKVYWTAPTTRLCHMMGLLKVVPAHISHVEEKMKLTGHFTNWQVLKCPSPTNGKFFRPLLNVFFSFTAYQRNSLSF